MKRFTVPGQGPRCLFAVSYQYTKRDECQGGKPSRIIRIISLPQESGPVLYWDSGIRWIMNGEFAMAKKRLTVFRHHHCNIGCHHYFSGGGRGKAARDVTAAPIAGANLAYRILMFAFRELRLTAAAPAQSRGIACTGPEGPGRQRSCTPGKSPPRSKTGHPGGLWLALLSRQPRRTPARDRG